MNTLLADLEGRIYDPLGRGLEDLGRRQVIFVGDPEERIAEDYLRILRYFRFLAGYGKGVPDPAALEACRNAAPKIATLSRERITKEFLRLVNTRDPVPTLHMMEQTGVLSTILPTDYPQELLDKLCRLQEKYRLVSVAARLLVLIDMDIANIPALETSLSMSNALKKEILSLKTAAEGLENGSISSDNELIYKYNRIVAVQAVLLSCAEGRTEDASLSERIDFVRNWVPPEFPVTGEDVMDAGISAGPEVGRILSAVEQWWIDRDFRPGREECLAKVKDF
jgi:poly(A) polymerase